MPSNLRVLIGILYCGEREFEECITSIKQQSHKQVNYFVIENQPNKIAHEMLYKRFMDSHLDFDLFVKLDADMALSDSEALQKICSYFEHYSSLDHLILSVFDYYTQSSITGIHIFSNRCKWVDNNDTIFVDHDPIITGDKHFFEQKKISANLVKHAFNQSKDDAISYGLHKVKKILQPGTKHLNYTQACFHWKNLNKTIKAYSQSPNQARHCALQSMYFALTNSEQIYNDEVDYKSIKVEKKTINPDGFRNFLSNRIFRFGLLAKAIGLPKALIIYLVPSISTIKRILGKTKAPNSQPPELSITL